MTVKDLSTTTTKTTKSKKKDAAITEEPQTH
jgi:hypothetical protein